jgi:hypothetical protein
MISKVIPLALLAATMAATGCNVQKRGSNGNEDVKIETPLGGVKVKTNQNAVAAEMGLAVYPGATAMKNEKNNGAADVELSFGDFHLQVRAVGYHTPDSPEKVLAFYRKELGRLGDVIECKGDRSVGTLSKTSEGLTCDEGKHITISNVDRNAKEEVELKTGSKLHQHLVAVEPQSDGTRIGLMAFNLPSGKKESN